MLTAKTYLESVRDSVRKQHRLEERLAMAQERLDGITGIDYSVMSMPGSPNASDGQTPAAVMSYMSIVEALESQIAFSAMLVSQAFGMLEHMRSDGCPDDYVDELEMYYLWDMSSREIADKMCLSVSRVQHRRKEVLELCDGYVPRDAA